MLKKKVLMVIVSSLVLSFGMSPTMDLAAANEYPVCEVSQELDTTTDIGLAVSDTTPVCEHDKNAPHSTMRQIRVTTRFNPIENKTETLIWYQCTLCGYERYWVD